MRDWTDDEVQRIVTNVRHAAREAARLLVVEMVVRPENEPCPAQIFDVAMLGLTGGRECVSCLGWRASMG